MIKGKDCREEFRKAYENRYTWEPDFRGYKGSCSWSNDESMAKGSFEVNEHLKVNIFGIQDEDVKKGLSSQLWEVAIHRVRRSFDQTHGENTFTAGDENEIGLEVLVGGKSKGDRYRIKNNIVTMVYRHIHGKLINIFTLETVKTGKGYLSTNYKSQYLDPTSGELLQGESTFADDFLPLYEGGPWVLSRRSIETKNNEKEIFSKDLFIFSNLTVLD